VSAKKREPWIKAVGTAADPLPDEWIDSRPDLLTRVRFPERPTGIRQGDLLVYYAAGRKKMFAIARASQHGDNVPEVPSTAFPNHSWEMPVQVCFMVPNLKFGADYELLGEKPGWISKKSHLRLADRQYADIVAFFTARLAQTS
jgi:hypothetical protein